MFMNYMDYTYDACRVMFSSGQTARMNAYLNGTRASILTSLGGTPPTGGTCNIPAGLVASSITMSSVVFTWASTGAVSYNVHYKPTSSSIWTTVSSTGLSITAYALSASTTYEFQMQSVCSAGSSSYSSSVPFTTLAAPCNVPASISSTSVTSSGATFNWGLTGAISYNIHYKPTTSTIWTTVSSTGSSVVVSGLGSSTTYEFQVQSVCSSGSSSYSSSSTFTTLAASPPPCNVPASLSATSITSTSTTLNWGLTGAISYNVRYKPTTSTTWITNSSAGGSVAVSGLSASTYYEFQVESICSSGSSAYSASTIFKTSKRGH
jgi:uncharacterized membrane protein YuzA (DUF378 family)